MTRSKTHAQSPVLSLLPASVLPPDASQPLFLPRGSRKVPAADWMRYEGLIKPEWQEMAAAKGFTIDRRVRDRLHLALTCKTCGAQSAQKLFVLRTAQVACVACREELKHKLAAQAGLSFLGDDAEKLNHGIYRASCGHMLRRQFELIARVAKGECATRCETCHQAREEAEAEAQGWHLEGPDPEGNPNYRLYRHSCGHTQRIARANMQSGHCDCGACGQSWSARPSQIYLLDIRYRGEQVLKLGYSNDPVRRFRHQLDLPESARVQVLRTVRMPTGSLACAREKRAHALLKRKLPDALVPVAEYADYLNVVSEIYRPWARHRIEGLLDAIEDDLAQNAA